MKAMTTDDTTAWNRFLTAAHLGTPDQVPAALIVVSPGTLPENIEALLEAARAWRYT